MVWTNQRLETLVKKKRLIASVQTTRFTGGYDLEETNHYDVLYSIIDRGDLMR